MITIDDMRNEMDFFYHCKKFEYNHDFVKVFWKNDKVFYLFYSHQWINIEPDLQPIDDTKHA